MMPPFSTTLRVQILWTSYHQVAYSISSGNYIDIWMQIKRAFASKQPLPKVAKSCLLRPWKPIRRVGLRRRELAAALRAAFEEVCRRGVPDKSLSIICGLQNAAPACFFANREKNYRLALPAVDSSRDAHYRAIPTKNQSFPPAKFCALAAGT